MKGTRWVLRRERRSNPPDLSDLVLCRTKEDAERVPDLLKDYLDSRGLTLSKEKTLITHLSKGFDFLGINFRSHKSRKGVFVKKSPSKSSLNSFKDKVRVLYKYAVGGDLEEFITSLNNLIRGTAHYWVVSHAYKAFHLMDYFLINKTRKLLHRLYPKKSYKWIRKKHFRPDCITGGSDKFIFTNPVTGSQLMRMGWFKPKPYGYPLRFGVTPYDRDCWDYIEKIKFKPVINCLFG